MFSKTKKRRKQQSKGSLLRFVWTFILIALVTGAMLSVLVATYIKTVIMPDVDLNLTDFSLNLTTTLYYEDNETGEQDTLQQLHGSENRIWISYDEIPQNLVHSAIAIEDKRFEQHEGVDWIRTVKGVLNMFTGQDIQGGSTITQQLIKNLTTEDQVTVKRKIREIFRALEFEKNYSKTEILEWYLNYIYLGEGCNGVYTASYAYFDKHVSELSLAECASLIGITNNPSLYNPYRNPEGNKSRQESILWQMQNQGYITEVEYEEAVNEELVFKRGEDAEKRNTAYNWYVEAVIDEVIADLQREYNLSNQAAANMVYSGGLQIYTCVDLDVQNAIDEIYGNRSNLDYQSPTGQMLQSAITIIDNETGHVVGLAGAVGEKTGSRSWNRATRTVRPPGSAIKPLSVYGPALEMGRITPITIIEDSPYQGGWPVNSYGEYRMEMPMMEAMRISCNTVAVKILANMVTPQVSYDFMSQKFHIDLVQSRTVGDTQYSDIALAPLALGGLTDGMSTYDMAAAYAVFPRGGIYYSPQTYTKVYDSDGNILLEKTQIREAVLKAKTTFYMNEMLENVVMYGTGRAANFSGMTIAGKTGTTSSRKDLWFAGYTPYYSAAVWTGYDRQEAVHNVSGNPSARLFKQVMQKVHEGLAFKKFTVPDANSLVTVSYCSVSGLLSNEYCGEFANICTLYREDVPSAYCEIHKAPEVVIFDINDVTTWPLDDPFFDPADPRTWPEGWEDQLEETTDEENEDTLNVDDTEEPETVEDDTIEVQE